MAARGVRSASSRMLVGRAAELQRIERVLDDARCGSAGAVVVQGEPGIGKTRLMAALCEMAASADFEVLAGRGTEFEREVPFSVFVEAFDKLFASLDSQVIADLGPDRMAELAMVSPSFSGHSRQLASRLEVERFVFHRAIRAALDQVACHKPIVLALDDVQWADPASLELISYLLTHSVPWMVLALAYRPQQVAGAVRGAVADAAREGWLCELSLSPLTISEAAEALGEGSNSPLIRTLHSESGGNPFYLEQLARTMRKGVPTRVPVDLVGKKQSVELATTLRTTIAQELNGLKAETLSVLQAGALAGDPFEVYLVTAIMDIDEAQVLNCLEELVGLDLVRPTSTPDQFRFRHPIVRRVVYDEARPGWRFAAHKEAARALARHGAPVGARAHHVEYSASPGDEEAVATLAEAAQAVLPRAPAAAARWFEVALRLLPSTGAVEQRLLLLLMLAGALASAGHLSQCRAALEQALELLPIESISDRIRIINMIARADHGLGRAEETRPLILTAIEHAPAGSADAVRLGLELAENQWMCGQWEQVAATVTRVNAQAEVLADATLLIAAKASLAVCTSEQGDVAQAQMLVGWVADKLDSVGVLQNPELLEPLVNLVLAEIYLGLLPSAARHAERGLEASRSLAQGHVFARFHLAATTTKILLGQLHEARPDAEATLEAAQLLDNDPLRVSAESVRCWLETVAGDLHTALAAGRAAVNAAARTPRAQYVWLAHACYGQALIEAGEFERGRREIVSVGGSELNEMSPGARPLWYQALVMAELSGGRVEKAEAITRRMEDTAQGLPHRLAHALQARAWVHAARGDFPAAAASAGKAREYFDSAGTRVWSARARLDAGRALARIGESEKAVHELEYAYNALRDAGAARLADDAAKELRILGKRVRRWNPSNASADKPVLTERERDIAERVVQGYTNREIAAELFISQKTVEKHLARVFEKLGTSSRAGVAAAMTTSHDVD